MHWLSLARGLQLCPVGEAHGSCGPTVEHTRSSSHPPVVLRNLAPAQRQELSKGLPRELVGLQLAVLPVLVDGDVGGAVLLSNDADSPAGDDAILLLDAMARQVGISIGKARLMERLQMALDAKSEFVNTMSHELRSPLSVVIGYADVLLDGELDPKFVGGRIRDSALELLQLVDNSLTVARLGTGKLKLNLEEFSVNAVAGDVTEALRSLPEGRKGIPVAWHIDPALPRVELDRLKVKQILHNLVSNGLKYTDAGEVAVTIGRRDDQLRIEVRDSGKGIPQEAQSRIFEMFERVEAIGDSPPAGVGLGLYIVKSLVDLMSGTIQLVSEIGRGSCFTVCLPVRLTPAKAEASEDRSRLKPRDPNVGYAS